MDFPAKLIWSDAHGQGRNRYVLFRKSLLLDFQPVQATLHIFADTRYRLQVNGQVVCHGPARFRPSKPEYDTVDLLPWLEPGENVLAITVNSYGTGSFHSEITPGCLVTWGEVLGEDDEQISLAGDEGFKAIDDPARAIQTPHMSFALNPAEHYDARHEDPDWSLPGYDDSHWPEAVKLEDVSTWSKLMPRSIPMLDERYVSPVARLGAWAARPLWAEKVYRMAVTCDAPVKHRSQSTVGVRTFLHSPRAQTITVGGWWGRYFLNGLEVEPSNQVRQHMRQDFKLELQEGFNELQIWENFPKDYWSLQLGIPADSGVEPRAGKDPKSEAIFQVVGPVPGSMDEIEVTLPPEQLPEQFGSWRDVDPNEPVASPCPQRAWMTFSAIDSDPWLEEDLPQLARKAGDNCDSILLVYDFGTEVLGRVEVEFEAAEATQVDLSYSERLTEQGVCDVHYRFHVEMTERCISRSGLQVWQTFHPRGFRYLEVRVTGDVNSFSLRRVGLTRANYPAPHVGSFECSDPRLNRIWKIGTDALHACMEDAYLDCPHRERGLYSGDFLVEFLAGSAVVEDTKLFARCIELFLLGQGDNGLIPGGAQGLKAGHLPDYSAILASAMWWHWAYTGDLEFAREHRDRLVALLEGLAKLSKGGKIIDDPQARPYIDLAWMGDKAASCALNCFCYGAFRDGAALLEKLDDNQHWKWSGKAEKLKQEIHAAFWDESAGLYRDQAGEAFASSEISVHANALAVYFDIAPEGQGEGIVDWLAERMENNFRRFPPSQNRDCNVTSYFSYYPLEVLYRFGKNDRAEAIIGNLWGWMLLNGAWTTWEYFADNGGASLCHAWSAGPNYFFSREILGVRRIPGEPDAVEIDPRPGSLEWAQGTVPHPLGTIEVRWQMQAGEIDLQIEAPDDLDVRFLQADD